jgi:hypothetical protein
VRSCWSRIASASEPRHLRHLDVGHEHVRVVLTNRCQRRFAIADVRDHLDARF